jgi:hypothetical protein
VKTGSHTELVRDSFHISGVEPPSSNTTELARCKLSLYLVQQRQKRSDVANKRQFAAIHSAG